MKKEEFCIMPVNPFYSTRRRTHLQRHEVFFGKAYRQKSIDDGLVVFLTPEMHEGTNGVHGKNGDKFNRYLKQTAERAYREYYGKTKEEFIERYGKSNLDD